MGILLIASGVAGWLVLGWSVPKKLFTQPSSTLLYSREGELMGARIAPDGQWRFPAGEEVPHKLGVCLTRFEDKRFAWHPGVDPLALARAVRLNLRSRQVVSGGSTLTMQLARLARGNRSRNWYEKGIEACWALYLESRYSKKELLALYASHAPFGGNVVGMDAAAWRYFGREADELSWAESATLAVLPNAPALIHLGRNRQQLREKRDRLLHRLYEEKVLDRETFELACLEPLPEAPLPLPDEAPHLLERLAGEHPGTAIESSLQYYLQRQTQQIVNRYGRENSANHIYNLAALVADVETGEVLAYAGNVSDPAPERQGNQVDVIIAPRSTGSILKPFLYAGMLNEGMILPGTLVSDIPLNINGFMPQNYHKTFWGAVPAHMAIERSLNVPLVRMLSQYNTGRFMALLKRWGMTTLRFSEDHYGAALILGGAEGTLWDLTGMYGSLSRVLSHYRRYNGRYDAGDIRPLTPYLYHEDCPVQQINDPRLSAYPVLSYASIWYTYEAMSALNRPEEESDWQQFGSMKRVAWKTGTSYGGRDAWAIGTTSRYVVGVWVGNASGEGRPGLTGVASAAPVLFDLFSLLPDSEWFDRPYDELTEQPVCRLSGHKASVLCDVTDTVYIPLAGMQTAVCPYHRRVHLTPDERYRVNASCQPVERMVTRSWFVLPPAQAWYYRNYHADYRPLPPIRPGCEEEESRALDIIYPEHNALLYLPKGFSGERERFVFKAAHTRPDATIFWHLDNHFLGETTGDHQIACEAGPGRHLLSLVDEQGNERKIFFEVKSPSVK